MVSQFFLSIITYLTLLIKINLQIFTNRDNIFFLYINELRILISNFRIYISIFISNYFNSYEIISLLLQTKKYIAFIFKIDFFSKINTNNPFFPYKIAFSKKKKSKKLVIHNNREFIVSKIKYSFFFFCNNNNPVLITHVIAKI